MGNLPSPHHEVPPRNRRSPVRSPRLRGFFCLETFENLLTGVYAGKLYGRLLSRKGLQMRAHHGKFVAYYRVYTDRQGKSGLGLEAQKAAVADRLNGGSWQIVQEFTETESGKRAARPQLDAALAACKKHKAKLIVAKLDRLSRNVSFLLRLIDSGVEVLFADLPELNGAMGRFMLTTMASVAELEAGLISERTKAALKAAKARGVKLGRHGPL